MSESRIVLSLNKILFCLWKNPLMIRSLVPPLARLEMREGEEEEEVALMPLISHPHFELRDGRRKNSRGTRVGRGDFGETNGG